MRYIPEGKMAKLFVFVIVAVLVFQASFAKPIEANGDNLDSDELIAREAQFEEKLAKTINDQYKAADDRFAQRVEEKLRQSQQKMEEKMEKARRKYERGMKKVAVKLDQFYTSLE